MDVFFWLIFGAIGGFFFHFLMPAKYKTQIFLEVVAGAFGMAFGRILAGPLNAESISFFKIVSPFLFGVLFIIISRTLRFK